MIKENESKTNNLLPIFHIENNNIYFCFSDKYFNESEQTIEKFISNSLKEIINKNISINENQQQLEFDDNKLKYKILEIFNNNDFLKLNSKRYKNYTSHLTTYINDIELNNKPFYLHLYILPKEIELKENIPLNENNTNKIIDKIHFIEQISFNLFNEYSKNIETKSIKFKLLKEKNKAKTFLDMEMLFYKQQLENIENLLTNHNWNYITKTIIHDKLIGIITKKDEILNRRNGHPFKIFQTIKVKEQSKLAIFIQSTLNFLDKEKISIFKDNNNKLYKNIQRSIKDIINFVYDLNSNDIIEIEEIVSKKTLKLKNTDITKYQKLLQKELNEYFSYYEEIDEIQNNIEIFNQIKFLFINLLENGSYIYETIDMSRFLEKTLDNNLKEKYKIDKNYKVFKGDENSKKIYNINDQNEYLSNTFTTCEITKDKEEQVEYKFGQYPDNLIIKTHNIINLFETSNIDLVEKIYDAKYYLLNDLKDNEKIFLKIKEQKRFFEKENCKKIDNLNFLTFKKDEIKNDIELFLVIPSNLEINIDEHFNNKVDKENCNTNELIKFKNNIENNVDFNILKIFEDFEGVKINIIELQLFDIK